MKQEEAHEMILQEMIHLAQVTHMPLRNDEIEFSTELPQNVGGFFNPKSKRILITDTTDYSTMLFNGIHEFWHRLADYRHEAKSNTTENCITDYDEIMADSFAHIYYIFYHKDDMHPKYLESLRIKYSNDHGGRKKAINLMFFRYGLTFLIDSSIVSIKRFLKI